jgi:phage tail sheath protein FI
VSVPPSGHVAGLYARNDFERGIHKAPANMTVRGVTGLSRMIGKADQALLNPAGINCFRWFSTEGVVLWGARTLASDPQWRYVNVRRMLIMIERSFERSLQHCVFQPNDHRLWRTIRRDISAFLTLLWRQKYLMGTTPEQAFFVKCDEETNPPEVVDAGRVETLIGVAPVKPAEFVIFRIGQSQSGATSFENA